MKLLVDNRCDDYDGYRAARVKSLFNAETGSRFTIEADLPIDDEDWRLGVIVGPSGSGKTSLGREVFGPDAMYEPQGWPDDEPIIEAISPDGDFNDVTAALSSVGLGTVPSWLRPYRVLSMGEQFRADMARIIMEAPAEVVIDEFTSVVDRQIARIGALAFGKAWKRTGGKAVLLTPHYDVIDWLEPDWVYDTATGKYSGRGLWRRPRFDLEIWQTDQRYWDKFEVHHYLKLPPMVAMVSYVATVDGELVAHMGMSTRPGFREARGCRLVVMPEWQGAGVGTRFMNTIAQMWLEGDNRYDKRMTTLFHTSHPGLCSALRRSPLWTQVSAALYGGNRGRSMASIQKSFKNGNWTSADPGTSGYGGHFRAIQGFRYIGHPDDQ